MDSPTKEMVIIDTLLTYIDLYVDLIDEDISNFISNRKASDKAHKALQALAEIALEEPCLKV